VRPISPRVPPDGDVLARHLRAITILLAGYHLRRLNALYVAFKGDLLLPIALAEVGVQYLRETLAEGDTGAPRKLRTYRRPQLSRASGIPRETVRRAVRRLVDRGWLQEPGPRTVALTDRASEFFGAEHNRLQLDDLLWTGDRVHEVVSYRDDPRQRAALRDDLMNALATRAEDLVQPIFSTQFAAPTASGSAFSRHPLAIAQVLTEYWLRHLYRLQDAFDGDLVVALLLGEIAHYNVGGLAYRHAVGLATLDALFVDDAEAQIHAILRPCNAHSLSLVSGVPDSSVRRKLRTLLDRGWIAALPAGYVVTPRPAAEFMTFNEISLREFLETERRLRQLCAARAD
jgi:hypothetical protein